MEKRTGGKGGRSSSLLKRLSSRSLSSSSRQKPSSNPTTRSKMTAAAAASSSATESAMDKSPKSVSVDPAKVDAVKSNISKGAIILAPPLAGPAAAAGPHLDRTWSDASSTAAMSSVASVGTIASEKTVEKTLPSECEALYGPYPRSVPVPRIDEKGATPHASIVEAARTMWDLKSHPDHRDVGTPDEWIPRDGRLVRLTGRHPFNVEPPLSVLNETRFLTPACLHYVRNHGACPNIKWEDHRIKIGGEEKLVPKPYEITMDELVAMEPREFPCTLVCAGNRRKEQNMIRQTIGFNWGPSGVGTNVWKGVLLRDLLLKAGVSEKGMAGKHVEFIGVEDLPNKVGLGPFKHEQWGKLVKYGTSVPLARAMNPAYDIIVAYQANGQVLHPDHGYPVRLIIPGYIGGRMIKWLEQINVIDHETWNHYHYHDNRILPPHITAEESLKGEWWYKPEYIFNELNINSIISQPDHNEELSIARNIDSTYEVAGYAYTGGGRRVTRVEISTDAGVHWNVCELDRKEHPTEHGMYWCWIWYSYSLPVTSLVGCKELWCRAWDDANNVQPEDPTWNLMGMGNNQIFRVKVHMEKSLRGEHVFRFEHPTQPGQLKGGWMTKASEKLNSAGFGRLLDVQGDHQQSQAQDAKAQATTAPAAAKSTGGAAKKMYTLAEVEKHDREDDVWIVVNDKVYDCTDYLELHPGGADSILINAGADATEDFVAIHSTKATKMLDKFYVGDLDTARSSSDAAKEEDTTNAAGAKVALDPRRKVALRLRSKTVLSRDSFLLDFALQSQEHVLGLPTGKHMFLCAKIDDDMVMRRYTPISSNYDVGCVKFVIKAYRPTERFPRGGKMSQHLDALELGDTIDVRGPVGEFEYLSSGTFLLEGKKCSAARFNMIAGGTGITPCMQIAAEILRHPKDPTQMSLVFACREEGDLLMRSVLDEWSDKFPEKFKVHYILSDAWPSDWKYSTGFVNKKLFVEHLYKPGEDVYNLMCGPPVMLDRGCTPNLVALGHKKDTIFSF